MPLRGESSATRYGFTLVELLVVMTILGIMMGIVFGAIAAAKTAAQISHTKATITKLHHLIMARYELYKTRRVPLDAFTVPYETSAGRPANPRDLALARLYMIRDIMRQEIPERLPDYDPKLFGPDVYAKNAPKFTVAGISFQVPPTPLFQMYMNYYKTKLPPDESGRYHQAETLYMVVTMSCPDGRAQFSDEEIGDADNDGWPEFIDGWGNPILFLRCAPKFNDSAIQWNYPPNVTAAQITAAAATYHDPFDPMNVELSAYELIPLIYSAGPNGVYDIDPGTTSYRWNNRYSSQAGRAVDWPNYSRTNNSPANGRQEHFDNIHNHRLGTN